MRDVRLALTDRRFRRSVGTEALLRAARQRSRLHYIGVEYPPTALNEPRYGWGKPPHRRLAEIIGRRRNEYADRLRELLTFRDDLLRIEREPSALEPGWRQQPPMMVGLDAVSLYGMVRLWAPRRYIEVGSGNSTKFVARARKDGELRTRMVSIDPAPRVEIDALCDELFRAPLESVDLAIFGDVEPGDVILFDGSHRAFMNSDVAVFFLDILPSLPDGVLVAVHDIMLPWDYPPYWAARYYSEQYLLASYLLAEGARITPVLPCHYVTHDPELGAILDPLFSDERFRGLEPRNYAFWLTTGPPAAAKQTG